MELNRRNYLNKVYTNLHNTYIIEYDIKSAGLNVMYAFGLISKKQYQYYLSLDKKSRNIRLGLLQRDTEGLANELGECMLQVINMFIKANNLEESDILSVKNDAIFVINKKCTQLKFNNIEFVAKNKYTSYYLFDGKEFYYSRKLNKDILHVKGVNDETLEKHNDYMLDFLKKVFRAIEVKSPKEVFIMVKKFAKEYRDYELPVGYYRELNHLSLYRLNVSMDRRKIGVEDIDESLYQYLNYNYNYKVYILNILKLI